MPSPVSALRIRDPEQLVAGIRGANLEACQLAPGSAPSEMARALFRETCLDMAHIGPAMLFSGATPADCYTVIFVAACPTPGRSFNFQVEHTDGYMGFFAPGQALDATTPAGYRNGALTLPVDVLHRALAPHFEAPPEALLARGAAMRVGPEAQRTLRAALGASWRMMWDPAQPLASAGMSQNVERNIRTAFMEALRSGCDQLVPQAGMRIADRHRRFRKAREFVEARLHEPIYLDDVCRAVGVSRRTMEVLFRDFLGMTPISFLRQQRLRGVHRALKKQPHKPGVIKRTAIEWGFCHLGHFTRDYRTLFGETPQQTRP